jgi:DnaK suppressor protein
MTHPTDDDLRREFEPLLRGEFAEIERSSAGTAADRAPVTLDQQSVGGLARMDAMQLQAMTMATEARRHARRFRIQAALARMEEGEFGRCTRCGEFIGPGRMRVDPTTALCVDCASGA